jgi:hypothetical protein
LFNPVYQADYWLNGTGADIWSYLVDGWSLRDISLRLQEESGDDEQSVNRELLHFINKLCDLQLVKVQGVRPEPDSSFPNTNGPRIRIAALEFVAQALSPHSSPEALATLQGRVASGRLPWQLIRNVANHYRMSSTLFVALRTRGLINGLPKELCNPLSESYELTKDRNLRLRAQATEIINGLNSSGIEPILLKGIAHLFSNSIEHLQIREMADIDLMVPKKARGKAIQILTDLGYKKIQCRMNYDDGHHHGAPMVRGREEAPIELHSDPAPRHLSPMLPTEQAWLHSRPVDTKIIAARVLCLTHRVLLNVLHSELAHDRYLHGLISLRDLHEFSWIGEMYAHELDWRTIADTMKRHGEAKILRAYFHLAYWLFGMPLPNEIRLNHQSALHCLYCKASVKWPLFAKGARGINNLSAKHLRGRYSCNDTRWALAAARGRYIWYLARRHMTYLK